MIPLLPKAPNNNTDMSYQNDENHLTNLPEYFMGGG